MPHHARIRGFAIVLASVALAACGSPSPLPSAVATAAARPGASPGASPGPSAGAVPLDVRFAGGTNCASFPYTCFAVLSVLEPNAAVPDSWRPAASDPRWFADDSKGKTADTFNPKPLGS